MKIIKKIASVVIASTVITSSLAFSLPASAAADLSAASASGAAEAQLADSVGDGVIMHAFNWSYNSIKENLPAIAAAGYTTVQTSPVQQAKDYGSSNDVAGQWWKLYQPVSESIAQQSWLGTKDDLKALCDEADKYGVKIICDIVSNHMGNETEDNPNSLSEQVKTYQPDFYENKDTYFRNNSITANDSSVQAVVQGHLSACPDLNTGNKNVQNAIVALLEECIDCGVDGFRFDAAKHIETPDDGAYASDYWPTITSAAQEYYNEKTGGDIYIYGEILNNCGSGRSYSSYTKYINVTDNRTGDSVLYNVVNGNASRAASSDYRSGVAASDAVLWAESHDTYEGTSGSAGISNTASVSNEDIVKAWAIVASRADSTALYFARPGSALMGEAAGDVTYKSTAVSEVNKFHNAFVGQSEALGSSDGVAYVVRGSSGIVLSNCEGTTKDVSISGTGMANGTYTDTITGNKFTVANGVVSGTIGSTGVAVVYDAATTPKNTVSVESTTFAGESMTVTLGLEHATSGTYCLDNSTPVSYTGTTTIRIGSDYAYGDTINLTVTATDGNKTTSMVYRYTKEQTASSGVYIFFNPATRTSWNAPFNVYIYDEDTSADMTYSNAAWPGAPMQYDEATGYYYYEVSSTVCRGTDADGNVSTVSFDLAHSANANVIVSDSSNLNSAPRQYPGANSKTKLAIGGSSKILGREKSTAWEDTQLVPTETKVDATDVTMGTAATEPTTGVQPTTPVDELCYGDVNADGVVNVLDATLIQKHLAFIATIQTQYLPIADVNNDGIISINDATAIQYYASRQYEKSGRAGESYAAQTPTQPTTQPSTAATKPTAAPTQPTTAPEAQTYTLYFKTTLGWMTSDGVSLFAYDTSDGTSYLLEKDEDAYPNVYTAEVPEDMTSCVIYRNLEEVYETPVGGDAGNVYNCWSASVSSTNCCITLNNDEQVSVGPYVEETKPEFELSRVYFDNSLANWSEVYIYGWAESNLGNAAARMTNIPGTDIWYYDFDVPLLPNSTCFLFKDTSSTWVNQTNNITVVDGKNCYRANSGSKSGGVWLLYNE